MFKNKKIYVKFQVLMETVAKIIAFADLIIDYLEIRGYSFSFAVYVFSASQFSQNSFM